MKAQTTNILSERNAAQASTTTPVEPPISVMGEPSLLGPKNTVIAKKTIKWVLYLMVLIGIPVSAWIMIGKDYSMWEDWLAWIAGISILGIFFIKYIKDDLSWDSIKTTFKWFAITCILIILCKEAFIRDVAVGEKGTTDFSVISVGAYVKDIKLFKEDPPPPPKTWQVVREITKKGEGLGEKDYFIVFSEPGKIKAGDRIDVYSKNALVWYKRAWRKTKKGVYSYTIKKLGTRSGVAVRAPRGQQYSVKIFRLK